MGEAVAASEAAAVAATMAGTTMTLADWLDDLTVRFLLNLPPAELSSVPRLCFQVEEAQWYYEDFIRPAHPQLPGLNLKQFCLTLFQHCPLLSSFNQAQHLQAYDEFLAYKVRVPVRGAILLDASMDKVLLVRGWKKNASWSFPRGKINKDEDDLVCAMREVYEETGYDISGAGLDRANEQQQDGQVKSIDVTMREQHMKLFVFRGVPLDTFFEPRTRKEISKIQWYNVKDLPGFKKQKGPAGQGQGEAQASKFYMVAPFLGKLKQWIGQQRKQNSTNAHAQHSRNVSAADIGFQSGATEDEGETEQESTPENGVGVAMGTADRSADALKRMLFIGAPSPDPASPPQPLPQPEQAPSGNLLPNSLLAILHGASTAVNSGFDPRTPLEQIDPMFPAQPPETPQPHHPRNPSDGMHQQVPSFPYSPQRLQQQQQQQQQQAQRNFSVPYSGDFGPNPNQWGQHQRPPFAHLPPHLQQQHLQQQSRQHSLPTFSHGQGAGPHYNQQPNAIAHSLGQQQQQLRHPHGPIQQFQSHANAFAGPAAPLASPVPFPEIGRTPGPTMAQALQTPQTQTRSGPSVPEPSKLPTPKLNAHSMDLLNAFKSANGSKPAAAGQSAAASIGHRAGSQQQAALLDLFRKPSGDQPSPKPLMTEAPVSPAPASPALTDVTVKPRPLGNAERRPVLNEITRTLPPTQSANSPVQLTPVAQHVQQVKQPTRQQQPVRPWVQTPPQPMQAFVPHDVLVERPKSRGHLFDPAKPQTFGRASSQNRAAEPGTYAPAAAAAAFLQKPTTKRASRSPQATPKANPKHASTENGQPTPQFSILQRPGSSAGRPPRSPAPQSPLRHDAPQTGSQPQILKRHTAGASEDDTATSGQRGSANRSGGATDGKKDHLLSLFSKAPTAATVPPFAQSPAPPAPEIRRESQQHNALLGLFNGAAASPVTVKTSEPPPTPQLPPERKPSSQGQQAHGTTQQSQHSQQLLLNLFNKPSSSAVSSPGTPISPFTLGTPVTREPPLLLKTQLPLSMQAPEPRSRLGSITSPMSNGTATGTGTGSGQLTPTESSKGVLLNFLNDIVQKEGHRGTKKG